MKPTKEIEKEIEVVSNFAYKTLLWVWKHEDESYRDGTFESISFAISNFIEGISRGPHKFVSYITVATELGLDTNKDCPSHDKIKSVIKTLSCVFDT